MPLDEALVKKAVNALFVYLAKRKDVIPEEKQQLFEEVADVQLQISLKEGPAKKSWRPFRMYAPFRSYPS